MDTGGSRDAARRVAAASAQAVGRNQEGRNCQERAVGHNRLEEGCQGRPMRLQGRQWRWRHRRPLLMLGVGRSTHVTH
jgi:hypothetical protein